MAVLIRPAGEADRAAIEGVVAEAYGGYIARIGRKPGPMLDDYRALIAARRVFALDCDGHVDGLVVLIPEESAMLLDNVAIRPAAQGRGYGRLLLEFAQREAVGAGYLTIRLYTHELMTENIAIYAGFGFLETHRAEQIGLRRVFMAKHLDGPA